MKYTRLYADADSETHFEDIEADFQQTEFRPGVPLFGVTKPETATDVFFVHTPAEYSDDYHPTPRRLLIVVMTGEDTITASDGEIRRFGPKDVVLIDDMGSKGHKSAAPNCEFMFIGLTG